ncbi:SRPBCC family protein [Pseudonocardia sp. CA-107938]|uniref:SRPBCC family protein n=1 Tax=Pseudonocardia sp. CA-107938 TaxID=3240021 RepID=UPI003D8C74BB
MASLTRHLEFGADADTVWAAVRAVATPHVDLVPGFVIDARREGDSRLVTFVNGSIARELIVDVDDSARRLAYAVVDSPMGLTHHHATMQVDSAQDGGSRMVWTVDALPDTAAARLDEMMALGARTMLQQFGTPRAREMRSEAQ